MHFGIISFPLAPYDALARVWRDVEELGFHSAWLADDLNIPRYSDFEVWTLLAALARETTHMRIGTMVSSITFRHPAFLAAQVITVDHISGGRAELGLGSGGSPNNYAILGLDAWPATERFERMTEQVVILERLLCGEPVAYKGQYYQAEAQEMPKPIQQPRPPLILAAHGERGLRLVAQYADAWNSLGGQPYPAARYGKWVTLAEAVAVTQQRSDQLDAYCQEIGREQAEIRRTVVAYRPIPDPLSSLDAFDEYVGRYQEIGIDDIIFYWPPYPKYQERIPLSADQQARFERIAAERIQQSDPTS
jgi:alkanesulfonate monooxygenase SsuD/methylene tetrahydromethanopterin reductase-like flavin-dependent oxidoreductase (luciferase family)